MKEKFKISLLDNGVHSLKRGLDEMISYEKDSKKDNFQLKEAIMFLHHGIELLMKQVLINKGQEHLIFDNIDTDTVKKVIKAKEQGISVFDLDKPVHTATYINVIQRIKAFIDSPKLDEPLETRLNELNVIRNNIEHYGINTEKSRVENLLLKLRKPISEFFKNAGIEIGRDSNEKWEKLEKQLIIEVSKLRGGGSIKVAKLANTTAIIEYVENYQEYLELQPQSSVTEKQLNSYWSTGDAILKAMNDGAVRLMRNIDHLNEVKIRLPYGENVYSISITKSDVEDYLGYTFEEVRLNWDEKFSNQYVYDPKGRKEFFTRFGKIDKRPTTSR